MTGNQTQKRILVTGGGGFIGSHLCERLLACGHSVLCVGTFSTGSKSNIAHMLAHPAFEVRRHDITTPLHVEVDEIYNLACPASPVHYERDPVRTTKTSVQGAINVLDLAERLNARVLQVSTSEVYGDCKQHPQSEAARGEVNHIGMRACYEGGKRCAETLFFDYHRQYKLKIKVARLFNTYGPRMDPAGGRVVSTFIIQALSGEPITLFADGMQTRSFCYVDDIVTGIICLMNSPDDFTGPVNFGNPREITLAQLAEKILAITASHSKIVSKPLPPGHSLKRCPDISLAHAALGWEPMISVDEGLAKTVEYFRTTRGPAGMGASEQQVRASGQIQR